MKIRGRNFKLHQKADNKGSAMVIVIIAMAFIGILASVLMYMSLLNYQMKANNLKAKDNFYSAETVLDEIRMHMGEQVSTSLGDAYRGILLNYDDTTAAEKETKLRYYFLNSMQKQYKSTDSASLDYYSLITLYDYLSADVKENTVLETSDGINSYRISTVNGTVVMSGTDASGKSVSDLPKGQLKLYTDGLSFCDLKVTYIDSNGYVSVIKTDIRVKMPDMEFAQAVNLPALTGVSMVAKDAIQAVPESGKFSDVKIGGSFYANRLLVGAEDDINSQNVTLHLEEWASQNDDKRMVVASEIYMGKGAKLLTDEFGELWTGKITMNGAATNSESTAAYVDFGGNDVYVAGDLRMDGAYNKFSAGVATAEGYSGQYIGFGTGVDGESSAIVVNGTDTEIDLSNLTNLSLAGNTYVATAAAVESGTLTDEVTKTSKQDIMMGQSIAVKSDQLAYLVPAGLVKGGTNPVVKEQADAWGDTAVDFNAASSALSGNTLASYGITKFITDSNSDKQGVRKLYKRLNSTTTVVYYYVAFDNTTQEGREAANRYFQDFYRVNKSTMDAYASIYTDGIKIPNQSAGAYIMHLAGNVVMFEKDKTTGNYSGSLQNATLTSDRTNTGYQQQLAADQMKFRALTTKLIDGYDLLTPQEKEHNIYENLVDQSKINEYTGVIRGLGLNVDQEKYFKSDAYPDCQAVIVSGDYTYPEAGHEEFKSGLIIATGNVTLKSGAEFKGAILSGGNIFLGQKAKVTADSVDDLENNAVIRALQYTKEVNKYSGMEEYSVADFLLGGEGYTLNTGKAYVDADINLGDLIVYENWQKQ